MCGSKGNLCSNEEHNQAIGWIIHIVDNTIKLIGIWGESTHKSMKSNHVICQALHEGLMTNNHIIESRVFNFKNSQEFL